MSLLIAIIGYFLLAIVVLLDKKILTTAVAQPIVYTFYSTVFLLGLFLLLPFHSVQMTPQTVIYAGLSGISFGFALWTMFVAIKHGEASHSGPFIGAFITLASFILGALLLNEHLSSAQQVGIVFLIIASLLLSFEKTKRKQSWWHTGYLWGIISGILFGLSHVTAKVVYDMVAFLPALVWTKGITGMFALFLLLSPTVRRALAPHTPVRTRHEQKKVKEKKMKHTLLVVVNKLFSVLANGLIQYAIAIGSVTLVTAIGGIQYVFLFLLIVLFSKYYRSFFQEYMTKREISVQIVALGFVMIGAALFAF